MRHPLTCPHCASALLLPEGAAAFVECPRCGGRIPHPQAAEGDGLPAVGGPILAIDVDRPRESTLHGRRIMKLLALLLTTVGAVGLSTGVYAGWQPGWRGLDVALTVFAGTLVLFALLVAPLTGLWVIYRFRQWRREELNRAAAVILGVFFWFAAIALCTAAAFVLFFLACVGGEGLGKHIR